MKKTSMGVKKVLIEVPVYEERANEIQVLASGNYCECKFIWIPKSAIVKRGRK